jgi:peptidyl-prolyl cis-trans isomerase B (cyclophilin B)
MFRSLLPVKPLFSVGAVFAVLAYTGVALAEKPGLKINTTKGTIIAELYEQEAPKTVNHIQELVRSGFYSQPMSWHRVVPGFVIQTGDPTGTGSGGAPKTVPLEVQNDLTHVDAGILGMARSADINSASSQFYITLSPQHALDAKYAVFGRVIQGMDILDNITPNDVMMNVELMDVENVTVEKSAPEQEHPFWGIFKPSPAKKKSRDA